MTPHLFAEIGISPALAMLPPLMDTPDARAFVLAICLQESKLQARRQFGHGPARGYPEFELVGIEGVFTHRASRVHATALCLTLDIGPTAPAVYEAIEFNDVLAAGFARLLIWTLPMRLPNRTESDIAWSQYLQAWNPGKPHPETWESNFNTAWEVIDGSN